MKKQLVYAVAIITSFVVGESIASAHNLLTDFHLQMSRYVRMGPTYGCHSLFGGKHHFHCHDCLMPWQPIRSTMHRSVLPPSMLHPPALHVPNPWLAPPTPNWSPTGSYRHYHRHQGMVGPQYGPPGVLAADGGAAPVIMPVPPGVPPYATGYAPLHILERGPGVGIARP